MSAELERPAVRLAVRLGAIVALAAVYFAVARSSLLLALPPSSATPVWPTTGLALAALLLGGVELWPGIAAGAFVTNVALSLDHHIAVPVALWTSVLIAAGNTAEAVLGAYLVVRFARGREAFSRAEDVFLFVVLAGLVATLVSATIGVATLGVSGIVPWALCGMVWWTWWLGDSAGALVVTPFLLAWGNRRLAGLGVRHIPEILVMFALLVAVGQIVFVGGFPLAYLLVPFLLWAAFRFGRRGAATMTLIIAGIVTWGTIDQRGPFVRGSLNDSLVFLQIFISVFAVTSLVLAAVLTERKQVAARLAEANRRLLDQIAEVGEAKLLADRGRRAAAALASDNARLYAAEQEARMRAEVAAMDAERANHAKSEFLAVMSHELRTPLNAVVGYTDLMASEVVGPINETQRAQLARVRVSTQHLISLIEGVLALARGDAASEELNIEPVDACTLGRQSAALLEEAAAAKGLSFDLSVPGEPHLIETDATKVRQILINLLANAIKFTDRGAVALTMRPGASHVAFEVRDTGIGIAPEHQERVFEPFWQVDQSTTRRAGGTGLGLGVTRGLARQLGGDVTLASEPGRGSTFRVILPIRDQGSGIRDQKTPRGPVAK